MGSGNRGFITLYIIFKETCTLGRERDIFSVSDRTGFDYRLFSLFNFPGAGAAILDFMTSYGSSIVSLKRTNNSG